jgi:uncharacterized protein YwgA
MNDRNILSLVQAIVALNSGRLVGRTRFQKTVYLLEKLGLEGPLDFDYHHFGPYSAELAEAIDAASVTGDLSESFGVGYHGTRYSIFVTNAEPVSQVANVSGEDVRDWLGTLARYTGTDLELASTILFLRDECEIPSTDLDSKVAELKPVKASPDRLSRAWHLLKSLGLSQDQSVVA